MRQETTEANRTGAVRSTTMTRIVGADAALPWESAKPGSALLREPAGNSSPCPSDLANDRLESEIVDLVARLSSATHDLLVLIGELDDRGTYLLSGALSCAAWLADRCDIERVTAHNQVRVARALRAFPALDAAMACGDVSYAKARMLVPHLSEEHVDDLVHLAATTPTSGLAAAIARWSHRNESQDDIDQRHHTERSVSWRTDADGMARITARLAPADAAAVCAVIDKIVTMTPTGAGRAPDEPCATLPQQRADALVTVVTRPAAAKTTRTSADSDDRDDTVAGGVAAEIGVHVTAEGNTLADGTPLTDHAVTRLLPDAFVSLLLLDNERRPIDASPRRRFPTRRQRRVVDARQDECQWPGCHAKALLQYDHIQPHPLGGPTTIANLQRLCGPHNRAKYESEVSRR